jgi:molybdopterin-containing oxidoreductase family iron-sulfur binding subunit
MKENTKIYWKGLEQLTNSPDFVKNADKEFAAPPPEENLDHSRRDFLKMMGFGVSAVALAACEAPIRKAIPYVNKPVDLDPSIANYYASTYINGGDYCSIVVKTREGRPIKVDGNTLSSVTKGGTSAQVEASVLSLYDNDRLRYPKIAGKKTTWDDLDKEVTAKLGEISTTAGQISIVSNTVLSPSTLAAINAFKAKFPSTKHIQYDQNSHFGIWKANEESFGTGMIPSYDFSQAKVIVSVAADFLNSWVAPIEITKQYALTRDAGEGKNEISRHYHFESNLSITGANADYRTQIKPSEEGAVVVALYNLIAGFAGNTTIDGGVDKPYLKIAAEELWANRGKALVVAGSNDKSVQVIVNSINNLLGSYGSTILPHLPLNYRQGDDAAMTAFVAEAESGKVAGIIFFNCNPVYDHPMGDKLGAALKNVSFTLSTSYKEDETGSLSKYLAPDHHYLEAWNDAEPKKNHFSLAQPAITPIFKTRAAQESFLTWAGASNVDYFEFVKNNWRTRFFKGGNFQAFWDKCLYDGVLELPVETSAVSFKGDISAAASAIASAYKAGAGYELVIYENGTVGNGSQANNPLLQELPEPITKAVWDHYVLISQKDAAKEGITNPESKTKYASLTANGKTIKLPVLIQPGLAQGVLAVAIGYGRTKAGKVADGIGVNVYPWISTTNGSLNYNVPSVSFKLESDEYQIAQTQTHHTYMGRQTVIKEYTTEEIRENPSTLKSRFEPKVSTWMDKEDHQVKPGELSMWKGHEYKSHHWGMSIDLNTCTGCAACVVACNVENNVALVGRQEVINRREMHWLRIDRYYSSDAPVDDWKGLEEASDSPEVVFQPMLCQHCNNAPCETVCPVAATTHSSEGLNQMTYNRCIGTRYCANNCPYKVRRFNWFKYHDNEQFETVNVAQTTDIGKMVLNPDVTVRSRGVMEKCSFCVQRIQNGKLTAKKEKRELKDGEVVTACQTACSTGAITFGDMNDPNSKISKLLKIRPADPNKPYGIDKIAENPRAYSVLEEIGVKPNIFYLAKIRNKETAKA